MEIPLSCIEIPVGIYDPACLYAGEGIKLEEASQQKRFLNYKPLLRGCQEFNRCKNTDTIIIGEYWG
jgi:hypothetical protein